jgi:hypothetical protein
MGYLMGFAANTMIFVDGLMDLVYDLYAETIKHGIYISIKNWA